MGQRSRELGERRDARRRKVAEAARGEAAGRRRGCLVCRRRDVSFTTVEHVFPESIGNADLILPVGVVCDRCNNGVLSVLDQAICEFMPVMFRRTTLGIRSKQGSIPTTRFSNGSLSHDGNNGLQLVFDQPTRKPAFRETSRPEGGLHLNFSWTGGKRMTPRYGALLSRALLKTALECAWIDHGEMVLEERFDHLRAAVLGEPRDGYLALVTKGDPDCTNATMVYDFRIDEDDVERTVVLADYYGVTLATDSRLPMPPIPFAEDDPVLLLSFKAADFRPKAA